MAGIASRRVADHPDGQKDQVRGADLGHPAVGPAVRGSEPARRHATLYGYSVHSLDESGLASVDADTQHRCRVIARNGAASFPLRLDCTLPPRAQEHVRAAVAAVPLFHGDTIEDRQTVVK